MKVWAKAMTRRESAYCVLIVKREKEEMKTDGEKKTGKRERGGNIFRYGNQTGQLEEE